MSQNVKFIARVPNGDNAPSLALKFLDHSDTLSLSGASITIYPRQEELEIVQNIANDAGAIWGYMAYEDSSLR